MSENTIEILDNRLRSFFNKDGGQIADVISILNKKEKHYLFERLRIITDDSEWQSVQQKLFLKIGAVNSLILFIVERPQLNKLITKEDKASAKTTLVQLYELLYELNTAFLDNLEEHTYEKLEGVIFSVITGVCADRTPDVAMLIEKNNWINEFNFSDIKEQLKLTAFRFNLSLYGRITDSINIESINDAEKSALSVLSQYQHIESEKEILDIESGFIIGIFGNLIHVLRNVKEYLFTGKTLTGDNLVSIIETYIYNALNLSKSIDSDSLANIIHHSRYSLEQLYRNSIWQVADRSPLIKSFFENSIEKGGHLLLTLLPSQRKTVLDVLTAKKSIVVNMPTSSGKSLLAELYILFTIQSQTFGEFKPTIAYIVPTNALINQVKHKLRKIFGDRYKIESVLPYYEEDSIEEEILSKVEHIDVLVTTPEKLDFLVRNDRPVIKNLKVVILDEAHNLSDKNRGSKFELLLSVIKQKKSDVNYLLLSPFIGNPKEIAKWLGDTDENSAEVSISWTPTKQYIGCNIFNQDKTESYVTYFPSGRNTIVDEPIEIPLSVDITKLKADLNERKISSTVKIIGLLVRYLSVGETTLIFCEGPGSAQKIAQRVKEYFVGKGVLKDISDSNDEIQRLITLIKYESKEDDPLIDCLRYGVVYHHSQLSMLIKEEIEKIITTGCIRLIFATPTLAQGMNFPITTVIFDTTKLGNNSEDMPASVFSNIAGRAGRAFMDKEGHVIIGFANSSEATKKKTQKYIIEDLKNITSSLSDFFQSINGQVNFDYQLVKNNPAVSNFLQYLNHILKVSYKYNLNNIDTTRIRSMLNNSLFYRQIQFEQGFVETQKKVNDFSLGYINYLKGENKNLLSLADVFGISNISLNVVTAKVMEYQGKLKTEYSGPELDKHLHASKIILDTKNVDDLASIVDILSKIPELKVNMREGGKLDPHTIARVIIGWVNGENVKSIASKTRKPTETDEQAIGICNKFINGNLRNYLPWGINIYQTLTKDVESDSAKMLPSFVYYGVNNKESVILANIGVPRFVISKARSTISEAFGLPITVDNMEIIREKLKTVEDFGVGENDQEKKRIREIVKQYV